jgi:hypothetical protein
MAIDTTFLKNAKDQVKAAKAAGQSFVRANPRMALGAAAAMAIAPALFSSENRNYLQTASITTPLIGAAVYAVPGIAAAFKTPGRKFATSISEAFTAQREAGKGPISYSEMVGAQAAYEQGALSSSSYSKIMRRWFSGRQRQPGDLNRQAASLMSEFESTLKRKKFNSDYVSRAIHAEKLRSLDIQGTLGYLESVDPQNIAFESAYTGVIHPNHPGWKGFGPKLTKPQMRSAIEGMQGNSKFMSGMQSRLQQMGHFIDPGGSQILSNQAINGFSGFSSVSWAKASREAKISFRASHPDVYGELELGLSNRKINPRALDVVSDSNGVFRALNYRDARIDLVDATGQIMRGEHYRQTGLSRLAYDQERVMKTDVYGIRALAAGHSPKDVQAELSRINLYGGVDGNEGWSAFRTDGGETVSSHGARLLRPTEAVPTELMGWGPNGVGYSKLTAFEIDGKKNPARMTQESFLNLQTNVDRLHDFSATASEGRTIAGGRTLGETRGLAFWGATSVNKQDAARRAFTKDVFLTNIPSSMPAFSTTDYLTKKDATFRAPEVGSHVGHISAQQKSIFGDLPEHLKDLTRQQEQGIIANMMEEASLSNPKKSWTELETLANKAWQQMQPFLSKEKNYAAMRHLGYMGEGTYLTERGLYGMKIRQNSQYDVHELRATDWSQHLGTSLEAQYGAIDKKGNKIKDVIVGYDPNDNPVYGRGDQNYIENVHNMGDGNMRVDVASEFETGTGTKWEGSGIKGEGYGVKASEMDTIRSGLNKYSDALKTGNFIPQESRFLQVLHYSANKSDPTETVASMAGDMLRRLHSHDQLHEAAPYLDRLQKTGADFDPERGMMTFDTSVLSSRAPQELHKEGMGIMQEMMEDIGKRVRSKKIVINDPFFNAFRKSKQDWASFVQRNADPRNMRVTNTTQLNLPEHTKWTYDMAQQTSWRGQHAAAAEIAERVKVEGDVEMTGSLHDYLKGDASAITKTVEFSEALQEGKPVRLSSLEERAGTIFSEGKENVYKDNFLLKMPDGSAVPVLGHDAYGGQINVFGAGRRASSDMEKTLNALIRGHRRGDNASKLAMLRTDYENTLKMLVHGKANYLRAENSDPLGFSRFLQSRSSSLKYSDGSVNPFQIGVDPDMIERIGDKAMRDKILAGEGYGAFTRHPVSHVSMMQIVPDENLRGSNMFGIDESMRALHFADHDGDAGQLFMLKSDEAVAEARNAVHDPISIATRMGMSVQRHDMNFQKAMEGAGDDSRMISAEESALKPLFGRAGKVSFNLDQALLSRSTGGTVGMFSNTLTNMLVGLDSNSNVLQATEKTDLGRMFFSGVRQGTIAASKHQLGGKSWDRARAMGINMDLRASLGKEGSFDQFFGAMRKLGSMTSPEFVEHIEQNEGLLHRYHSGVDWAKTQQAARTMTDAEDATMKVGLKDLGMAADAMPYVQTSSRMANEVAATQGAINDVIKSASGGVKATNNLFQDMRRAASSMRSGGVGKAIGIGLAAAAVLGVASTSLRDKPTATFGRPSESRYRAEEMGQASPDGDVGTRAPANPPRHVIPAQRHVQTAVAAPLGETRDLDVQLRAQDQSRAHETAKLISRMSTNGDSHITVNYRGRMKPGSLRTREKVRGMLDN